MMKAIEPTPSANISEPMTSTIAPETVKLNRSSPYLFRNVPNIKSIEAVLLILITVALILLVILIRCMVVRKARPGYQNVPRKEPKEEESATDVISEVAGRREIKPTLKQDPAGTNTSKSQKIANLPVIPSVKSKSSATILHVLPSTPSKSGVKPQESLPKPTPPPLPEPESSVQSFLIALDENVQQPVGCSSKSPSSIKLLPHDRLPTPHLPHEWGRKSTHLIPAKASLSAPSFTKVCMDDILSLSSIEKRKAGTDFVLQPELTPTTSHTSIQMTVQSQPPEPPKTSRQADKEPVATDLISQLKKEEWDKFLKAFSNNLSSRRRSLCTVDDLQNLENAIATKAQSMPAMCLGPFSSEIDGLASVFEIRPAVPPSLQFSPLGNLSKKISALSLKTSELEEMSAAFALLTKLSKGEKLSVSTPKTSSTSIWSTVASENAFEPERVSLCSRKTSLEDITDNRGVLEDSDFEDPFVIDDEALLESARKVLVVQAPSAQTEHNGPVEDKPKRLTTAQRIDLAAQLLGFVSPQPSNDTGFLVESDIVPSEMFPQSRESSSVSSSEQFWTIKESVKTDNLGNFWAHEIVNSPTFTKETQTVDELDPYRITSKLKQALIAAKAKSCESLSLKYNSSQSIQRKNE